MIRGNFGNQGTVPKGQCIQQNLKSQNTPYNNNMNQQQQYNSGYNY